MWQTLTAIIGTRSRSNDWCFLLAGQYNSPEYPFPFHHYSICNLGTYQAVLNSQLGYRKDRMDACPSLIASYVIVVTSSSSSLPDMLRCSTNRGSSRLPGVFASQNRLRSALRQAGSLHDLTALNRWLQESWRWPWHCFFRPWLLWEYQTRNPPWPIMFSGRTRRGRAPTPPPCAA